MLISNLLTALYADGKFMNHISLTLPGLSKSSNADLNVCLNAQLIPDLIRFPLCNIMLETHIFDCIQ